MNATTIAHSMAQAIKWDSRGGFGTFGRSSARLAMRE
jgi:hypothetical protein